MTYEIVCDDAIICQGKPGCRNTAPAETRMCACCRAEWKAAGREVPHYSLTEQLGLRNTAAWTWDPEPGS